MTPQHDPVRIAVWAIIILCGLIVLAAVASLALVIGLALWPPVWAFIQAHADGLAALVVLAMLAIVGKGVLEA